MTQPNYPENPGHTARIEYIIPRRLPESSDTNQSMGDWPQGTSEEAQRRGSWPIIKIIWPEDDELLVSAHAVKTALKVANDNVAKDPLVSALAEKVAAALPPPAQVEPSLSLPFLMKIASYAKHTDYSESYIKSLIKLGLPTLRTGKARRVHVERANLWLETNEDLLPITDSEDLEDIAKANARGSKKGTK